MSAHHSASLDYQGMRSFSHQSLQALLLGTALIFVAFFLALPLAAVFAEAFAQGAWIYLEALHTPETLAAIRLTLTTALIAVTLNLIFGLSAAWLLARFHFPGRKLLLTIIDLPLAVSPVIAGMIFVLLYGNRGLLGHMLTALGIKIIYAEPGIILATTFITVPYIARELIPLMLEQGSTEEEAALTIGARGSQVFRYVTLPNIRWALLYGIILCNARAMGEFGAVSVVSGHIRGLTNTMPLHIEILYNEYKFAAAFAVASLLAFLALVTLAVKSLIEWQHSLALRRKI